MRILITLLALIISTPSEGQFFNKKLTGDDIGLKGRNAWDYFGRSVAISDSFIVVGANSHTYDEFGKSLGSSYGAAFLYKKNGINSKPIKKITFSKRGLRIGGDFGMGVALTNDILAVGAINHNYDSAWSNFADGAGAVFLYGKDEGGKNNWGLLKKITAEWEDSNGRIKGDHFGFRVALSDSVLVVGVLSHDFNSVGKDSMMNAGAVYIYERNKGGKDNWGFIKKVTGDISGKNGRDAQDYFGGSVVTTNDIIVIGANAHPYDEVGNNFKFNSGAAYILEKNRGGASNWGLLKKVTSNIGGVNERGSHNNFGSAVSISNDDIVIGALGQGFNSKRQDSIFYAGAAYILNRNKGGKDNWGFVKKITGEYAGKNGRDAGGRFGHYVSIKDNVIAVAAPFHKYDSKGNNALVNAGAVYLFNRNVGGANNWGFVKKITGEYAGKNGRTINDNFGTSVSVASDEAIVVGAVNHEYDSAGADSLLFAGAAFLYSSSPQKIISPFSCGAYKSPQGKNYTQSGEYIDTIKVVNNLDSIVFINLTVVRPSFDTISPIVCDSYLSLKGLAYTSSGTYYDTLVNAQGCDSIITINLTVNKSTTTTISPVVCNSYLSPKGVVHAASGTYNDTLMSSHGCDSIITINLTVNKLTTHTISPIVCNSYLSPKGITYTTSGTYYDTLINSHGCDSILAINLTVNYSSADTIVPVACDSYISPSGKTYTVQGQYSDTLINSNGCDSIITIYLVIVSTSKHVTQSGNSLVADDSLVLGYQWLNCNSNFTPISGETSRTFLAKTSGSYAVEITNPNNCIDTSSCINIKGLGLTNEARNTFVFYPNPAKDLLTISFLQIVNNAKIKLVNIKGQIIFEDKEFNGESKILSLANLSKGVYFIEVAVGNSITRKKIIRL